MLQPVLATALVSQMLTEWAKVLLLTLITSQMPQVSVEFADQLVWGLKYICDTSLDAATHSLSVGVQRRVLWLKSAA